MAKLADLIWKNAELLRGAFKENEYRKVILPFTILRRLDCVLGPSRVAVLKKYESIKQGGYNLDKMLTPTSGYPFFNISKFTLPKVAETPDDVRDNLEAMVNGFSRNVRDIFEKFGFIATIDKLTEKNRLFLVVQRFAETDLSPKHVTNHDMGQAFEELLRKFNDVSPAGEQYTPRDVIELMVTLLSSGDDDVLSVPGVVRTMYDPTAGTGGILSVAEEYLKRLNSRATLKLFGQELEDETYAICKADMPIRGQDPANIANGDTLDIDKHPGKTFEYQAANPPDGVEWKPAEATVRKEHTRGAAGRFAPGLSGDALPGSPSGNEWAPHLPNGWQIKRLKHLAQVRSGIAKGKDTEGRQTVELPYLRVANVQDGHLDPDEVSTIEVDANAVQRFSLQPGDVLMNEGGDYDKLGRGAIWSGEVSPCLHQNHVFAVRPVEDGLSEWLAAITQTRYAKFYFMNNAKQSTNLASISQTNIKELPVLLPPKKVRDGLRAKAREEAQAIAELVAHTQDEIRLLKELRAATIAQAVLGRIDVRTADFSGQPDGSTTPGIQACE